MRKYWCPVCEKPIPADQLTVNAGDKVSFTMRSMKAARSHTKICYSNKVGKITDIKMILRISVIAARYIR
ncbi:hypothetical protein UA45_08660 [Morganella morganii]|uniref:Uncharacterized protein n=1 Tax=Morganella morganii TaxID=582 RepID=A0A0D8LAA6_MORMO|nr:hypothetical protein UA45_08660 [Morganella morganii]